MVLSHRVRCQQHIESSIKLHVKSLLKPNENSCIACSKRYLFHMRARSAPGVSITIDPSIRL